MKKSVIYAVMVWFSVLAVLCASGQVTSLYPDSVRRQLSGQAEDSNKVKTLLFIANSVLYVNPDSAYDYAKKATVLATQLGDPMLLADTKIALSKIMANRSQFSEGIENASDAIALYSTLREKNGLSNNSLLDKKMADCYNTLVLQHFPQGNYSEALRYSLLELPLREKLRDLTGMSNAEFNIGNIYYCQRNYPEAIRHDSASLRISEKAKDVASIPGILNSLGLVFFEQGDCPKAMEIFSQALIQQKVLHDSLGLAEIDVNLGALLGKQGKSEEALKYDFEALGIYERANFSFNIPYVLNNIALVCMRQKKFGLASQYLSRALRTAKETNHLEYVKLSFESMATLDSLQGNFRSAWDNYRQSVSVRDSLQNLENTRKITQQQMQYEFDQKNALAKTIQDKKDADNIRTKTKQYFIIAILALAVLSIAVIAFTQFRSKRQKQIANGRLELEKQKVELTLQELKSTQAQLIQSEKMASLGELTAGIAHEIQNPLNFVNNFSEVNKELTEELESELKSGNSASAIDIARDIHENSEKINHHGKRAESIVKGMLQHSRTSSGQKEPTDINALCDEYLRLAYHGLRAKDKSFNARYETHFDPALPPVNVVPQDIGRVILNLVNNAFYAVSEKKAKSTEPYDPTVILTTHKLPGKIEITVEDNGLGIPDKIKDKIFQPFFTTKPTGQGTGLGLSLAYDIVTKGHGGGLKVETKDGQGSLFFITLPG